MITQEIQSGHPTDSDSIGGPIIFYLIPVKPIESYRHSEHGTTFGPVALES